MMSFKFGGILLAIFGAVYCAPPEVPCPVPVSPEHGQAFLYQEGLVVKYVCEPGYALKGKEIVRCVGGEWEEPNPACLEIGIDEIKEDSEEIASEPIPPPPPRPLFSWGSDNEQAEKDQEVNATSEELPMNDEARIRLLMLPHRRVITSVRTAKYQTELEEEEKKRSQGGKSDSTSTTIHMESAPNAVYVRRTVIPGKSEASRKALHMTVENGDDVQLISLPRAAVSLDDVAYQSDEVLRQLYWYAHHYPGRASLVDYRTGVPYVTTLTDSQLNWINSLPTELRDQYLKDLYVTGIGAHIEPERVQSLLARDAYNYIYGVPYVRRPVSLIVEDPISTYDYSCHESSYPFIKAPRLRNMHVARYDKRQNPNNPHNHYLSAIYRCNPGYIMLDTRYTELHCSKKDWIGVKPVCVRRG